MGSKIPESVMVVIHTQDAQVLLLERADQPGFWQSVTGSKDRLDEPLIETCLRELDEETGLKVSPAALLDWHQTNRYEIFKHWRHRYPDGVTQNTEHVFGLQLPAPIDVRLAPREHLRYAWLDWQAAADRCFSWSNAEAIRSLPARLGLDPRRLASPTGAPGGGS